MKKIFFLAIIFGIITTGCVATKKEYKDASAQWKERGEEIIPTWNQFHSAFVRKRAQSCCCVPGILDMLQETP